MLVSSSYLDGISTKAGRITFRKRGKDAVSSHHGRSVFVHRKALYRRTHGHGCRSERYACGGRSLVIMKFGGSFLFCKGGCVLFSAFEVGSGICAEARKSNDVTDYVCFACFSGNFPRRQRGGFMFRRACMHGYGRRKFALRSDGRGWLSTCS